MNASKLDLEGLLVDSKSGPIGFKAQRQVLWDAEAFGILRKELISSLGIEGAAHVLRRVGFAHGYREALRSGQEFNWDSEVEWWLSCPALDTHKGTAEHRHLVVDRDSGTFELEVVWKGCCEASQHAQSFGTSHLPVCWTTVGFASGFATALMGREVYFEETECAAMGGGACRAVGRTLSAWGADGPRLAASYKPRRLNAGKGVAEESCGWSLVSRSQAMANTLDVARTVARLDGTVLITGEHGVGKEAVARFVHAQSERASGPFVKVNCTLPELVLSSELFGQDGESAQPQWTEAAVGGTLYLAEVSALSPASQTRLFQLLEQRASMASGGSEPHPAGVRVLAATSQSLQAMVSSGAFHEGLHRRLSAVSIEVPPLRQRREDVLPLIQSVIADGSVEGAHTLAPDAMDTLSTYSWPGNLRELENTVEHALAVAGGRPEITRADLPPETHNKAISAEDIYVPKIIPMATLEQRYTLQVLDRFKGNRTHTAKALGIGANTLWRKLKSWGVPPARES